eukprot:403361339
MNLIEINKKTTKSQTFLKVVGTVSAIALASAAALFMLSSNYSNESAQNLADFFPMAPPGTAYFYSEYGFGGRKFEMNLASGVTNVYLGNVGFNDDMSSFQIGEGLRVRICKHAGCGSEDHWDNALDVLGPYNTATMQDGVNDMASQIQIYPYDPKTDLYVQGFSRERYESGHAGLFAEGQYTSDDIKRHHIDKGGHGGALTSIVVPDGLIVTLYKGDFYGGERVTIQGPKSYDMANGDLQGWYRETRSMQVIKKVNARIDILTQWERVSSGSGTLTHSIEKGWSKDTVQKEESTVLEEFTATIESGFSFMGAYEKTTLSNHVSVNIFKSSQRSIHQSKITIDTVSCDNKNGDLVALYQWTLTSTQDGENDVYVQDSNFICRYGLNSNSGPECPLTMCADAECTKCTGEFRRSAVYHVAE